LWRLGEIEVVGFISSLCRYSLDSHLFDCVYNQVKLSIMSSSGRQYDIVLYGATGYTGKLTALHMATHLPTDISWAISGRSQSKLEAVAAACKALNPDRIQPGEVVFLYLSNTTESF
jgi:hypothetical protein